MAENRILGQTLKQARLAKGVTLFELSRETGISSSFIGRIERGERSPSGHILKKLAGPLGFDETNLLTMAGMLSENPGAQEKGKLDPYVASILSQEPVKVQRIVVSILTIIKTLSERG